jgi:hypothetical protein
MSWTQGFKDRTQFSKKELKQLDKVASKNFGRGYLFSAQAWDEIDPLHSYLYFVNNELQDTVILEEKCPTS